MSTVSITVVFVDAAIDTLSSSPLPALPTTVTSPTTILAPVGGVANYTTLTTVGRPLTLLPIRCSCTSATVDITNSIAITRWCGSWISSAASATTRWCSRGACWGRVGRWIKWFRCRSRAVGGAVAVGDGATIGSLLKPTFTTIVLSGRYWSGYHYTH